jgi:hypothetical protein
MKQVIIGTGQTDGKAYQVIPGTEPVMVRIELVITGTERTEGKAYPVTPGTKLVATGTD